MPSLPLHPKGHLTISEVITVCQDELKWVDATGIRGTQVAEAARHPAMHGMAPQGELPGPEFL